MLSTLLSLLNNYYYNHRYSELKININKVENMSSVT